MDSYGNRYTDPAQPSSWGGTSPHDTAPMPPVPGAGAYGGNVGQPYNAGQSYYAGQPYNAGQQYYPGASPADMDYEEYFWGEGTEVPKRRRGGCCSIVFTLLLCVALVVMLLPMTSVNLEVLRGTSLHHLENWLHDSFGIELPEPAQEQLDAIYAQDAQAEDGYFKADPPTGLSSTDEARHYYRSALTEHAAEVYDAIEAGLLAFDEDISLPSFTSAHELETVWMFVLYDHPDIFWLADDARVSYYEWLGNVVSLQPEYTCSREDAQALTAEYENLAWELPLLADTQAQTMENICAYVADSTDYVNSDNDQYIDSVFTNHASVCSGYAKAVQFLALRHGIPCVYLTGTADDFLNTGGRHAWLAALVDGEVRFYDPTWYDQLGWHADQFLGMNLVDISADHTADYPQLIPR